MGVREIWVSVFIFVLIAGFLLQFFIIPATPWHAGHGLLAGGDWTGFHESADRLASLIEHRGWGEWVLRPDSNAPGGIAAALYALTGIHEPWVVLPLNAILYALAGAILFSIILRVTRHRTVALLALLPMLAFPSAAMIYGQIHKDVWMLAGVMCLLNFVVSLWENPFMRPGRILQLVIWSLLGAALIWVVRPYAVEIWLFASAMAALVLAFFLRARNPAWWAAVVLGLASPVLFMKFEASQIEASRIEASRIEAPQIEAPHTGDPHTGAPQIEAPVCAIWKQEPPVPFIDGKLAVLACAREGFRVGHPGAGSNIDTEIAFHDLADILAYIPRAAQIAIFAPFPNRWFERAVQPGGQVMRQVAALEMGVYYLLLAGLVPLLIRAPPRDRAAALAIAAFGLTAALFYALIICNVGTLYRMRYPVMLLLMALGVWGWWLAFRGNRIR